MQNARLPSRWPEFASNMLKEYFLILSSSYKNFILIILELREEKQSCNGRGGGTQRPAFRVHEQKRQFCND
jgi:hypothetical protein